MTLAGFDNVDLRNRRADYTLSGNHLTHDFRTNGTVELPIGPNKLLLANSSGWVARLAERWQASFIFNGYTGRPASVTGAQSLWSGSNPDVVGPFPVRGGSTEWGTIVTNAIGNTGGTYFGSPSPFVKVPDPACAPGGLTDVTDAMGFNLRGNPTTTGGFPQSARTTLWRMPKPARFFCRMRLPESAAHWAPTRFKVLAFGSSMQA
jgi:hypothetical protein